MTVLNPKPIIDREIQKSKRAVSTPSELFSLPLPVGDSAYVSERKCEFKLHRISRGKYYRIEGTDPTGMVNALNLNWGSPATILNPGSTLEFLIRIPEGSTLPVAPYSFFIGGFAMGFKAVSHGITFELHSGSQSRLDIESVEDEFGNKLPVVGDTARFLPRNTWLRIKVVLTSLTISLSGAQAIRFGAWYNYGGTEWYDIREVKLSVQGGDTYNWDFANGLTANGKTWTLGGNLADRFFDVELQHNNRNIIEQLSPYRLYSVVPTNGRITPENLGAKKQLNPYIMDDEIDATEIIQYTINTRIPIRVDGFYYTKGRPKLPDEPFRVGFDITFPTDILMDGKSDGVEFSEPKTVPNAYGIANIDASPNPAIGDIGPWTAWSVSAPVQARWYADGQNWELKWNNSLSEWTIEGDGVGSPVFRGRHAGDGINEPAVSASTPFGRFTAVSGATGSFALAANTVYQKTEFPSLGCLYTGRDPVDMFRVFTEDFVFKGGIIYTGNTKYTQAENPGLTYHTLSPYYVPPKVFTYFWYRTTMVSGYIETTIKGGELEVIKYNAGHIGEFWDNSRWPNSIPNDRPLGFGEFHRGEGKLRCIDCYAPLWLSPEEPYQDFGGVLRDITVATAADYNSSNHAGFKASNPIPLAGDQYAIDSPADYTVPHNSSRRVSIRWGNSSIRNVLVTWATGEPGAFWEKIDAELIKAKFPVGQEFRAVQRPGGSNQSFRIVSNNVDQFEVRIYRSSTAAWHRRDIFSWRCKTMWIQTPNTSEFKITFQPGSTLATSGDPVVTGLDENYSELDFPCMTINGNHLLDIQVVDLNLVNGNKSSWTLIGNHQLIGNTGRYRSLPGTILDAPANISGDIRNHAQFIQTRVFGTTTGFIGPLDNVLYYVNRRATVTFNCYENINFNFDTFATAAERAAEAVVDNTRASWGQSSTATPGDGTIDFLFNDELLGLYVTYNNDFNEVNDFIEIVISGWSPGFSIEPVIFNHYIEWAQRWTPRQIQVMHLNPTQNARVTYDLTQMNRDWLYFPAPTTTGNTTLIMRLIGCKSKNHKFWFKSWQAFNRNFRNTHKPYLSIGGGARIYNTTEFEGLRIKDTGTTYRTIVPQASPPANPTTEQLRAALQAAGIFF